MSGAALLLAGCSGSSAASSGETRNLGSGATAAAPTAPEAGLPPAARAARTAQPARLALASQSIIFTASLTIQAADVPAAATRATAIATAAGGYVSGENATASSAGRAQARVSLHLKIPVAEYSATLSKLAAMPGTRQISLSQQA